MTAVESCNMIGLDGLAFFRVVIPWLEFFGEHDVDHIISHSLGNELKIRDGIFIVTKGGKHPQEDVLESDVATVIFHLLKFFFCDVGSEEVILAGERDWFDSACLVGSASANLLPIIRIRTHVDVTILFIAAAFFF